MNRFEGRLALQQRVLPAYRAPFFDLLASACDGGMSLFTGRPRPVEGIATTEELRIARYHRGRNIHLLSGGLYLCYQAGLIDWLRSWEPEALIVEANPRYLATPAAVRWMHRSGKPVIGWGLGVPRSISGSRYGLRPIRPAGLLDPPLSARLWKRFVKQFDALIAYSGRGAEEYAALGFPREKIYVAHNSVSAPPGGTPDRRPQTVDHAPQTVDDGPRTTDHCTILFVGRLQERKRVDRLLQACAALESQPRLIIVGDGPERERLQALARETYPGAEFVGARQGAELEPYFRQADLFVLPGTGGLAVQEAMSYGLPVIVAQGDGTQDDLVRPENGWQIPPDDFAALVAALNEALADMARLRRMGSESYRIVREEINIEKMVEVFVGALNRLTAK